MTKCLNGFLTFCVGLIFLLGGCAAKFDFAGPWNYRITLDDGTTLEGETTAVVSATALETRIQFGDYSGVIRGNQIQVDVRENHEGVQYQVTGVIRPDDTNKLDGQMTITESHSNGEVMTTRVILEAWR